jgi:hypothetical protein
LGTTDGNTWLVVQNVTLKLPDVMVWDFVPVVLSETAVNENVPAAPVVERAVRTTLPLPPRTFALQLPLAGIVMTAFAAPDVIV